MPNVQSKAVGTQAGFPYNDIISGCNLLKTLYVLTVFLSDKGREFRLKDGLTSIYLVELYVTII